MVAGRAPARTPAHQRRARAGPTEGRIRRERNKPQNFKKILEASSRIELEYTDLQSAA